jgi:DNA-binding NarL/FixJ family response regulator
MLSETVQYGSNMPGNGKSMVDARSTGAAQSRVLLVDDHVLLRKGLAELLNGQKGLEVCGEATTLAEACSLATQLRPALVIVDISLEGSDGLELIKELTHRSAELPILVYSMHDEEVYAERALHAGAKGYVMKRETPERLLEAIGEILKGRVYVSKRMSDRLLGRMVGGDSASGQDPISRLSDRELEVFQLIGRGQSTAQIADALCLSIKTIETYREHIKQKLNLQSGLELMRQAVEWVVKQA